jgi:hypothetical protein
MGVLKGPAGCGKRAGVGVEAMAGHE